MIVFAFICASEFAVRFASLPLEASTVAVTVSSSLLTKVPVAPVPCNVVTAVPEELYIVTLFVCQLQVIVVVSLSPLKVSFEVSSSTVQFRSLISVSTSQREVVSFSNALPL